MSTTIVRPSTHSDAGHSNPVHSDTGHSDTMHSGTKGPHFPPTQTTNAPTANSADQQPEDSADFARLDPAITSDLQKTVEGASKLLAQLGARFVIQWKKSSGGELEPTHDVGNIDRELVAKFSALATQAVSQASVLTRIFTSRHQLLLVAAPLAASNVAVITVGFPRPSDPSNAAAANSQVRAKELASAVELAAAHLSISQLKNELNAAIARPVVSADSPSRMSARSLLSAIPGTMYDLLLGSRKKIGMTVATAILALCCPWPHAVKTEVTCEPAVRRFVAAPFDGKLLKTLVVPGERVQANQVLATLDGSDLRAQIAALDARLAQASQRRSAALSGRDASKAEFERLEIQHLRNEIELLRSRQAQLEIRSPMEGIVVTGDLQRVEGAPLAMGDSLFEIAPIDELVAEIAVPESEIRYVRPDMEVAVSLDADASLWKESKLTTIHPRNEIRDGASVFIAEAPITNDTQTLKPGMSGVARIRAGYRPVFWILFHKPYEATRQLIGW